MPSLIAKLDSMARLSKDFRDARQGVKPAIRLGMSRGVILVSRNVKEMIRSPGGGFGPLIAGKANGMFASWSQEVYGDGLKGASFSPKIYSEIMNSGRRAGAAMPPVEAIFNWIKDKRIKIQPMDRKKMSPQARLQRNLERRVSTLKSRLSRSSLDRALEPKRSTGARRKLTKGQRKDREIWGLAFVIARSIARKGIRGRHYVQKALQKSWPHLQTLFAGVADIVVQPIVGRT